MKTVLRVLTMILIASTASAELSPGYKVPENGKIQVATLSGSLSCPEIGEFKPLNLNGEVYSSGNYYPELQINFGCGGKPALDGVDLTLIAEIGDVRLEELDSVSSMRSMQNGENYNFKESALIKENMTYSMILNSSKFRGLLVFRVISYRQNILTIEYVTRKYSKIIQTQKSEDIEFGQKNSR